MAVTLLETLGTDLTVVNAARVSFNKKKENFEEKDERLIAYLANHGHWTPFAHPQLQFRIVAPIYVSRQLAKHQVGLVWNEVSRRYVSEKPQFYVPTAWRNKPENKKQGSGDSFITLNSEEWGVVDAAYSVSNEAYSMLIAKGVAPEQARMVLPLSMYTEWYWTGSLYAFARICNLRIAPDAQEETRYIAQEISKILRIKFPISWKYLSEMDKR